MMDLLNRSLGAVEEIEGARRWDGERLRREIGQRATVLRRRGIARGSRLLLLHGDGPAFFADLLAGWRLGACVAVANPALTAAQRATLIGFVEPAAILVAAGDDAATGAPVLCLARESTLAEPLDAGAGGDGAADDPALILFTSGTTGDPKGVVLGFGALAARLELNLAHIGRADLARSLCPLPTHFGHGLIGNCLTPLFAGCEVLLWPSPGVAAIAGLGRLLTERRVTFMSSVPAFWHLALRTPPPLGASLRRVHVGSAPLPAALWQRIVDWSKANVVNMYGITEAANWIAGAAATAGIADGRVGRPWGGTAAVKRADGTIAATGEGELLVRSPCLLQGYFRRPDLDAAALRDGWLHTGDSGRIDAGGELWLTGRRRDEINRAGLKIQPAEIDLFLQRHPAVAEACCFGWPDPVAGEILAAAIRPTEGVALDVGTLRAWCRVGLNRELVPEKWFILPEIPRTDRGKVSRRQVYDYCRGRPE